MTGKELIVYILQNNLENENVFKNGCFIGLRNEAELAIEFHVGVQTIRTWYYTKLLDGIDLGGVVFFPANTKDPRLIFKKEKDNEQELNTCV